jgi:hypothetical protein
VVETLTVDTSYTDNSAVDEDETLSYFAKLAKES